MLPVPDALAPALVEHVLATPNYSYEKRQRELAKKRKAEEKRQKKLSRSEGGPGDDAAGPDAAEAADRGQTPSADSPDPVA